MKLRKLKLNEASKAELNEREMCRVLGGGTPGCCQCGCNYEGKPGWNEVVERVNQKFGHTLKLTENKDTINNYLRDLINEDLMD